MHTILDRILSVNLIFSTVIFFIAARVYLIPKLPELRPQAVLIPILLFHSLRHLGLMFLAPGATLPGIPAAFAYPAAIGDLITALLAISAVRPVMKNLSRALPLVWLFNCFGSLDLLTAITTATVYNAPPFMGAAYWIPSFWVPALLVTHYITFVVLVRQRAATPGRTELA